MPPSHQADPAAAINPLDALRILRSAGGAMFTQAALLSQLAKVEWAEEKGRLLDMLVIALLGFTGFLCLMVFLGALVLACSWDTPYRLPAALLLLAIYGFATGLAWRRFQSLAALGAHAFAATQAEFSADMTLLKSKL